MRQQKSILLVEDEALIALSEKLALENYGYQVVTVHNGEAAVSEVRDNRRIDLVLMDIDLGSGMDGTEAAVQILKEIDLPLVFLSSHTEREIVEKTEGISSYGYVVKTAGITVLDAAIKMAFRLFDAQCRVKEQNRRIVQREQYLRTILDTTRDGFWLIDERGRIRDVNDAYCAMSGYSREELLEKSVYDISSIDDRAASVKRIERIKKSGYELFESLHRRKDGSVFQLEVSTTWMKENDEGRFISFYRDIGERKRAEEALKEHAGLIESLFDSIPDMVFYKNLEGIILGCNSAFARYMGLPKEEIIGKCDYDICIREKAESFRAMDLRVINEGRKFVNNEELLFPDGRRVLYEMIKTPYRDGEGRIIGVIGAGRDLSDRRSDGSRS